MKKIITIIIFTIIITTLFANTIKGQYYGGIHCSFVKLVGGDRDDSSVRGWSGLNFGYYFFDNLGVELSSSIGWVGVRDSDYPIELFSHFKHEPGTSNYTLIMPFSLNTKYIIQSEWKWNPFVLGGLGSTYWNLQNETNSLRSGANFTGILGVGVEGTISDFYSIEFSTRYYSLFGQNEDMSGFGDEQKGAFEVRFGFNFNFGKWKDSDGDGFYDREDGAPFDPEDFDSFEDKDGIPEEDNDLDGILDVDDNCPGNDTTVSIEENTKEDIDEFEDEDGCPDVDNDGDGIPDEKDAEPNLPEDFDNFEDEDGAPELDNDNDGILDADDMCPNKPENINGFLDEDGCPDEKPIKKPEVVFEKAKPIVLDGVTFSLGSAELTSGAKEILLKVVRTLKDYADMKLKINGHSDSSGKRSFNLKLSQRRADSVKQYLVNQGIDPYRLSSVGKGPDNPIATNSTKEGRAKNRRIEFIRTD